MFKKFISRFIRRNHYWRNIEFDELSELYTSMMFRSLAMNLVGIFIPIYLYQLGFPIWQVFLFYGISFFAWTVIAYPTAQLIAKVGPKHTMLLSYVVQVMNLLLLTSQEQLQWPLFLLAITQGVSLCLFYTAFHVDFSKINHRVHGGKEMGWMFIMERAGAVLGPIVGGVIAYVAGPQYMFAIAVGLLFVGIVPLFLSAEPTATNQKLHFNGLNTGVIKKDLPSLFCLNLENGMTVAIWPFFLSLYVFTDNPYVQLGSIVSLSVLVSIFMSHVYGKTIDNKHGRVLLRSGAIVNALVHLFRPLTTGYVGALGLNFVNEATTPAYRMPYMKGFYDAADDLPGQRIVYITVMETFANFGKAIFFMVITLFAYFWTDTKVIFTILFLLASLASLGIMLEKFKALDQK